MHSLSGLRFPSPPKKGAGAVPLSEAPTPKSGGPVSLEGQGCMLDKQVAWCSPWLNPGLETADLEQVSTGWPTRLLQPIRLIVLMLPQGGGKQGFAEGFVDRGSCSGLWSEKTCNQIPTLLLKLRGLSFPHL